MLVSGNTLPTLAVLGLAQSDGLLGATEDPDAPVELVLRFWLRDGGEEHGLRDMRLELTWTLPR